MDNKYNITCDIIKRSVKEYSDSINIFKENVPILIILIDLITKKDFINFFGNNIFYYSSGGNSTYLNGKISLNNNLLNLNKKKYIFSDIIDTNLFEIMNFIIPKPNINGKFLVNRIYCGCRGTGSHFHHHPNATNYLISGKKLWVIFPPTISNYKFYLANMQYGTVNEEDLSLWLNKNLSNILDNCTNCKIFIQEQGSVMYIPNNFLHFVLNLTEVIGITYSWKFNI